MAPMNELRVNKCPRRQLEVLFTNGCKNFYKLMPYDGCGHAWARWKRIQELCVEGTGSIPPRWVLIPFGRLEPKVQQYLSNEQFLRPVQIEFNSLDFLDHRKKVKMTSDGDKPDAAETLKSSKSASKGYFSPHMSKKPRNPQRGIRQVNRFGEGISEGCSFGLYLSYEDLRVPSKLNVVPKLSKTVLDTFGDLSTQKQALEHIHKLEEKVKLERRKERTLIQTPIIKPSEKSDSDIRAEEEMCCTLKTARCFRIGSSPFVVSKRIRQSRSVDSVTKIDAYEHGYFTTNLSLPNLDEIEFCRRNHRISYSPDFADEPIVPAISFWISNHSQGQFSQGRFFSVNHVNQKSEANRRM